MDLLGADSKISLKEWQIRTNLEHERIQERQPAMIGPQAHLDQVLLTHGCLVEGTVKRSVLFPGVQVEEGAVVEDSILFFDTIVEAGAKVKKVITDKRVMIGARGPDRRRVFRLAQSEFSPFAVFRADGYRTGYAPSLPDSSRGQLYPLPLLGRERFRFERHPFRSDPIVSKTLVMLLAGGVGSRLNVLVEARAKPAVPFGGNYRIIDFTLSNIMNSGLERVGVLTQYKPLSLMGHIGSGEAWDFKGRNRGIKILPPHTGEKDSDWYKGTADALRQNMDYLTRYDPEEILIVSGDHIYYMDYAPMIAFHRQKKADLTVAMMEVPREQAVHFGIAQKGGGGTYRRLGRKAEKSKRIPGLPRHLCLPGPLSIKGPSEPGLYGFRTTPDPFGRGPGSHFCLSLFRVLAGRRDPGLLFRGPYGSFKS